MKCIYILFDCRLDDNDKSWLIEGLDIENYTVIASGMPVRLTDLIKEGPIGRLKSYYLQIKQAFHILYVSNKSDIIIVWYSVTGQIISILSSLFGHRNMVLMNFLTPTKRNGILGWVVKQTVSNPRNNILVNSIESEKQYRDIYGLNTDKCARFHYFPDVYDNAEKFINPEDRIIENRYFFSGGMSNRDWKLLTKVAQRLPHFKFVCCALQNDFDSQVEIIPDNMEVYYNISSELYYKLMCDSYCVLLPLKNNSVSGLINILKAIQMGVPCYVSNIPGTKQYYSKNASHFLLQNNVESWVEGVCAINTLSADKYVSVVKELQDYINKNFSPESALNRMKNILDMNILSTNI